MKEIFKNFTSSSFFGQPPFTVSRTVRNVLQMKNTEIVNGQQIIKEQWDYTYDSLNRLLTVALNKKEY